MEQKITVADILKECNGTLIQGNKNLVCQNFSKDTRELQPGEIYVGIQGENFNGSTLYEQALEKGAIACLLQSVEIKQEVIEKYPNATIVLVENTVTAIQQLAEYKRSLYNIPVVAITGSVGKTSTKDMVASVLSKKYKVLKTQGNYNNEIGLPLTILSLKDEEAMVLEMGMNSFGEISLLTKIAKPDVAVITNVGTAHIGMLGSRESILKAKLEILEGLKDNGTVVINYDNDLLHDWYQKENQNYQVIHEKQKEKQNYQVITHGKQPQNNVLSQKHKHQIINYVEQGDNTLDQNKKYNIITYGLQPGSNILGKNVKLQQNGSECTVNIDGKNYNVHIPVGGEHFVSNSLCAISVAKVFNIPISQALEGIADFELTKRRMEIKNSKIGAIVINDCYNANYDSMKAALDYLGELPNKRKIAVLGDMLELGKYSKELHEKVGEVVANNKIDMLICVGEESKYIINKAQEKGMKKENIFHCTTNQEAIDILQKKLQKEDVVLLKASNGLKFIEICDALCE